ncbi:hypothetical protein Tco_0236838 [Tanacetum coccineum]
MDDSNITMEEYIKLEEEKAQKRRKVFNWETAKYGRIWYDEDIHGLSDIPSLLKVSDEYKKNGISHSYQKLKGFYKGVLNLGPDYIRDAKMEEWLTYGHISVHETEW